MTEAAVQVGGILATKPLQTVVPDSDAHRAQVLGVGIRRADTGSVGVEVLLQSKDTGIEENYVIWVPRAFAENIEVDPETLPTGNIDPMTGKKKGDQRQQYAINVANTDGTAELQNLLTIAQKAGFSSRLDGVMPPLNFEEYVGALNSLMSGADVVFVRRPEKNEENPQFNNRLKVKRILGPEAENDPKKLGKGVKPAWL